MPHERERVGPVLLLRLGRVTAPSRMKEDGKELFQDFTSSRKKGDNSFDKKGNHASKRKRNRAIDGKSGFQ